MASSAEAPAPHACTQFIVDPASGFQICRECGLQNEDANCDNYDPEQRYFGANDTRHSSNPTRCQYRSTGEDRTIDHDLEGKNFPRMIVETANDYFQRVTTGEGGVRKTKRSKSRLQLIYGCLHEAFKNCGEPQNPVSLARRLGISSQHARGVKKVMAALAPKKRIATSDDDCEAPVVLLPVAPKMYVHAIHLVPDILGRLGITGGCHMREIENVYQYVFPRSPMLRRCNPLSFAAGLVYHHVVHELGPCDKCDKKNFAEQVGLSEITILNKAGEIDKVYSARPHK
jgi:hypothetical protein